MACVLMLFPKGRIDVQPLCSLFSLSDHSVFSIFFFLFVSRVSPEPASTGVLYSLPISFPWYVLQFLFLHYFPAYFFLFFLNCTLLLRGHRSSSFKGKKLIQKQKYTQRIYENMFISGNLLWIMNYRPMNMNFELVFVNTVPICILVALEEITKGRLYCNLFKFSVTFFKSCTVK